MKKSIKKFLWITLSAIIIIVLLVVIFGGKKKSTIELKTTTVQIDSVTITVTATGEIQPVYKVDVGTQVSGIVQKLYVDFNSQVEKGDLLAELDQSTLLEQVNQSQAMVSNAESNLSLAQQNYDRIKALYDNKAATQASFEQATNQFIQAKNQLLTAKSDLQRAQVNLSYSRIYSPISGVVLNKAVEEGQTVASSFNTPTLFTIANNLTQMQVEADVDEADIGQVKEGQKVTFTVDAFPNDVFTGIVKQIRLEPVVTSNVVTYTVIIDAPNNEEKLFPGMTANVTIEVNKQVGLTIPMEALYYMPTPESMEYFKQKGITFNAPEMPKGKFDKKMGKGTMPSSSMDMIPKMKPIHNKMVWIKRDNICEPIPIEMGLSDGAKVVILSGLEENCMIIVGEEAQMGNEQQQMSGGNPFMMKPPQQKKR